MDSNYYERDQYISLEGSHPLQDKYSDIHMNIRSLPDQIIKLKPFLARLEESKIKFTLLCETLNDITFDLYNIAGYNLVCKNRTHIKAGGVGMYVSDRYEYVFKIYLYLRNIYLNHYFLK